MIERLFSSLFLCIFLCESRRLLDVWQAVKWNFPVGVELKLPNHDAVQENK